MKITWTDRLCVDITESILTRSICSVQVGACIADKNGVFAVGWNHVGFDGFGAHAETEAVRRANRRRIGPDSTIWVAARRRKSGNTITAKPCPECQRAIWKVGRVIYRDERGEWQTL